MAVPPSTAQISARTVNSYNTKQGVFIPQTTTTQSTASLPLTNPPELLCVDAVNFVLPATGTFPFTFPNMPTRLNTANPLAVATQGTQPPMVIPQGSMLIYTLGLMNAPTWVQFAGYAVSGGNPINNPSASLYHPAPFLGPGSYSIFGVNVTGTAGQKGTIVATVYIQRG
jgi:hypothetical protein